MAEAEGKKFKFEEDVSKIRTDFLEVFEFHQAKELIEIQTKELTAVCPFSGLPDIAELFIEYHPEGNLCLELKALKYYLLSFRNIGIYQEAVTKKIYDDTQSVLKTNKIRVTTIYNTRGGLNVTCKLGKL